jgi:hypothetical protein
MLEIGKPTTRTWILLGVVVVMALVAAWLWFGRGPDTDPRVVVTQRAGRTVFAFQPELMLTSLRVVRVEPLPRDPDAPPAAFEEVPGMTREVIWAWEGNRVWEPEPADPDDPDASDAPRGPDSQGEEASRPLRTVTFGRRVPGMRPGEGSGMRGRAREALIEGVDYVLEFDAVGYEPMEHAFTFGPPAEGDGAAGD